MKKIIATSSVLLGVVFLAGCGQQPVSQTQPATPAPATQQPTTNPPVATQSAPTAQTNTSAVIIPANWQTYTDTKNGFKFKYPNNFIAESRALRGKETINIMFNCTNTLCPENKFTIVASIEKNENNLTPEKWLDEFSQQGISIAKENIGELIFYKPVLPAEESQDVYVLFGNKLVLDFQVLLDKSTLTSTDKELLLKILSTFEFMN